MQKSWIGRSILSGKFLDEGDESSPDEDDSDDGSDNDIAPVMSKYEILSGRDETSVYVRDWGGGPTSIVFGGIHGDEWSGIRTAQDVYRNWKLESGKLIIIPEAVKAACDRGMRAHPSQGDINRNFPSGTPRGSVARALWDVVKEHKPNYLFDLHSARRLSGARPAAYNGDRREADLGNAVAQVIFPNNNSSNAMAQIAARHTTQQFDLKNKTTSRGDNFEIRRGPALASTSGGGLLCRKAGNEGIYGGLHEVLRNDVGPLPRDHSRMDEVNWHRSMLAASLKEAGHELSSGVERWMNR